MPFLLVDWRSVDWTALEIAERLLCRICEDGSLSLGSTLAVELKSLARSLVGSRFLAISFLGISLPEQGPSMSAAWIGIAFFFFFASFFFTVTIIVQI